MPSNRPLRILLRWIGTASLFALIFIAVPYRWMDAIHGSLGLGPLPDVPIVGYLARSTSAFYALLGGLFWFVSFDVERYRGVLLYLGGALTAFGVVLLIVDWAEGLPAFWVLWEGPFVILFGLAIWVLSRRIEPGRG